ncbi:uncharacterized protein LOC123829446 isoform X2 [Phyllostomus hastatus]|uniref:uncharacterized protein LOC123829446 isoform X2 n=1 Tax=Phyllostomus hastatus TaxID=9423 RepID=UPI001E68547D|nr:uncharacterized protein LOC123829446 isoform X2 [Phyllostomus hastatus]
MELLNLCTQDLRGYRIHTSMCKPSSCPEQWDLCKGTESYGNTHSSLAPGTLNPVCFFFRKNKLPTTKHWGTGARETELQAEQQSTTQVTMYPHNQPQVNLIPGNQPGLQTPASPPPAQRSFKEGKTLGALQILIGLIHFGLGSILGTTQHVRYEPVSFIIGCAFWGGISDYPPISSRSLISSYEPRSISLGSSKEPAGTSEVQPSVSFIPHQVSINSVHHFRIPLSGIRGAAKFSLCDLWIRYFWRFAHLQPPGALHCLHMCPLWLPTGLLRHRGLPDYLRVKPSVQPRTSELATILFP